MERAFLKYLMHLFYFICGISYEIYEGFIMEILFTRINFKDLSSPASQGSFLEVQEPSSYWDNRSYWVMGRKLENKTSWSVF